MKNLPEKIVLAGVVFIVTAIVLAVALQVQALVYVTFALLTAVSVYYTVAQMYQYLRADQSAGKKSQLWIMIVSIVITLAVVVISIFVFAGKLFMWY